MRSFIRINILIGSLFLSSCGNYLYKKTAQKSLSQSEQEQMSSNFLSVKRIVFLKSCTTCHQQYNTYQGVIRELAAIQEAVNSNRMPKSGSPLTEAQKEILLAWVSKGAPDQADTPVEPSMPMSLEPTWKSLSENVIFPKCLVCHNPQGQAKFLDLSSRQIIYDNRNRIFGVSKFIDLEDSENSYLVQVINDNEEPMPPAWSNIPRLTQEELKVFNQWLSRGLP